MFEKILSHAPLIGYFIFIGLLLRVISPSILRKTLFQALAFFSLYFTWSYMFKYFIRSFNDAKLRASATEFTTHNWLTSTALFEEAWSQVCVKIQAWWISQQLCLFTTGVLTTFLYSKGPSRKPWAYMLLGQVVAISFSQSLFLAELVESNSTSIDLTNNSSSDSKSTFKPSLIETRPSWLLCACIYISLGTVTLTPSLTNTPYFLPNLLIMHALLVLPLLPLFNQRSSKGPISFQTLYFSIAFISFLIIIPTYSTLFPNLLSQPISSSLLELYRIAVFTLFEHPAQSSIGFDVIFTTISFLIWVSLDLFRSSKNLVRDSFLLVTLISLTPVVGISFSGSVYLGIIEGRKFEMSSRKRD